MKNPLVKQESYQDTNTVYGKVTRKKKVKIVVKYYYSSRIATARTQAPLAPSIFIGKAATLNGEPGTA